MAEGSSAQVREFEGGPTHLQHFPPPFWEPLPVLLMMDLQEFSFVWEMPSRSPGGPLKYGWILPFLFKGRCAENQDSGLPLDHLAKRGML